MRNAAQVTMHGNGGFICFLCYLVFYSHAPAVAHAQREDPHCLRSEEGGPMLELRIHGVGHAAAKRATMQVRQVQGKHGL